MSRRRGLPKTGDRVSGTPNKKTHDWPRKLENLGCDPIEGLARIAEDPATRPELKIRCYAELAQYVHPKRKAMDLGSGKDGEPVKVILERIGMESRNLGASRSQFSIRRPYVLQTSTGTRISF